MCDIVCIQQASIENLLVDSILCTKWRGYKPGSSMEITQVQERETDSLCQMGRRDSQFCRISHLQKTQLSLGFLCPGGKLCSPLTQFDPALGSALTQHLANWGIHSFKECCPTN